MTMSRSTRIVLRVLTVLILGFIYVPLLLVLVNSFNVNKTFAWPPRDFTLEWWRRAADSQGALDALWVSVRVGLAATVIALVLGTMIAFALQRFPFYGRDAVSLLVILPIALPGIVTGIALNNAFRTIFGVGARVRHDRDRARDVLHRDRVQQRDRPVAAYRRALEQASADLGASGFTTFRLVTFPMIRSALLAGGAARVRAVVRRDHRDHVHRRREPADAADLDLQQPVPAEPGADRQRGRGRADRVLGDPGLAGTKTLRRRGIIRSWTMTVTQERKLVTEIPGPRSVELLGRVRRSVARGVGITLPVFVTEAGGGIWWMPMATT